MEGWCLFCLESLLLPQKQKKKNKQQEQHTKTGTIISSLVYITCFENFYIIAWPDERFFNLLFAESRFILCPFEA
jgi:hypothetical protein